MGFFVLIQIQISHHKLVKLGEMSQTSKTQLQISRVRQAREKKEKINYESEERRNRGICS